MKMGSGDAKCVVYSKRTATLMNDVDLTAECTTKPTGDLSVVGDIVLGEKTSVLKTGSQFFRWNLVFNALIWTVVPLPLWLPSLVAPRVSLILVPAVLAVFSAFWLVVSVLAVRAVVVVYRHRNCDFKERLETKHNIQHLVVLACYKEPLDLIAATVDTMADQTMAADVTMVLSFEERTPDLSTKQAELCGRFGHRFIEVVFIIHPSGLEGEIPGKCSNVNCGIRTALEHLKQRDLNTFNPDNILITTCDADSKFHPRYLEALTYKYVMTKGRESCIFQSPLLYNWNLDALCFVTRVTGLVRSFLMMGALIPLSINPMSIFSFSASLCASGDFFHPAYQMDDVIALVRWMGLCKKRLRIVMVPVPLISGPTSGRVVEEELAEWARQARRWTIGAAEVFHYFVVKADGIPLGTAVSWGVAFVLYYGVMLCCSSLYGVAAGISVAFIIPDPPVYLRHAMLGLLAVQYLVFAVVFLIDGLALRLTQPRIEERISFVRNMFHWVMSPFVMVAYSVVEFVALHELMVMGRRVCKHGASKKEALEV